MKVAKSLLLSLEITFLICFFAGSFSNSYGKPEPREYDDGQWYYINRGYPTARSGVSLPKSTINYPRVKLPFLSPTDMKNQFVKIIDLPVIAPTFISIYILIALIAYILLKYSMKLSKFNSILHVTFLVLFLLDFVVYFFIFPQV